MTFPFDSATPCLHKWSADMFNLFHSIQKLNNIFVLFSNSHLGINLWGNDPQDKHQHFDPQKTSLRQTASIFLQDNVLIFKGSFIMAVIIAVS